MKLILSVYFFRKAVETMFISLPSVTFWLIWVTNSWNEFSVGCPRETIGCYPWNFQIYVRKIYIVSTEAIFHRSRWFPNFFFYSKIDFLSYIENAVYVYCFSWSIANKKTMSSFQSPYNLAKIDLFVWFKVTTSLIKWTTEVLYWNEEPDQYVEWTDHMSFETITVVDDNWHNFYKDFWCGSCLLFKLLKRKFLLWHSFRCDARTKPKKCLRMLRVRGGLWQKNKPHY